MQIKNNSDSKLELSVTITNQNTNSAQSAVLTINKVNCSHLYNIVGSFSDNSDNNIRVDFWPTDRLNSLMFGFMGGFAGAFIYDYYKKNNINTQQLFRFVEFAGLSVFITILSYTAVSICYQDVHKTLTVIENQIQQNPDYVAIKTTLEKFKLFEFNLFNTYKIPLYVSSKLQFKYNYLLAFTYLKLMELNKAEIAIKKALRASASDSEYFKALITLIIIYGEKQDVRSAAADVEIKKNIQDNIKQLIKYRTLYLENAEKKYHEIKPLMDYLCSNQLDDATKAFSALNWNSFYPYPALQVLYNQLKAFILLAKTDDDLDVKTRNQSAFNCLTKAQGIIKDFNLNLADNAAVITNLKDCLHNAPEPRSLSYSQ